MRADPAAVVESTAGTGKRFTGSREDGTGAADITSNSASFARVEHWLQLDGNVVIQRGTQRIQADAAVVHLSEDERRVERLELHNHARIATKGGGPGSLESLTGAE